MILKILDTVEDKWRIIDNISNIFHTNQKDQIYYLVMEEASNTPEKNIGKQLSYRKKCFEDKNDHNPEYSEVVIDELQICNERYIRDNPSSDTKHYVNCLYYYLKPNVESPHGSSVILFDSRLVVYILNDEGKTIERLY